MPDSRKKSKPRITGEKIPSEKIYCISSALALLPERVRDSLEEINFNNDFQHFRFLDSRGNTVYARAHACLLDNRRVCMRPEELDYKLIWHEVAHVYTSTIKNLAKFIGEWERIAGNVYAADYERYLNVDPSEGMLTWYSRRNSMEDVAEWTQECLDYLYMNPESPVFKNKHFKTDQRYRQKLVCLRKYGFISNSDYKKLKPLFE